MPSGLRWRQFRRFALITAASLGCDSPRALEPGGGENAPPVVVLIAPADGTISPLKRELLLIATASDADGRITRVEFRANDVLLGTATGLPWAIEWTPELAGAYTLTARAVDDDSAATVSSAVALTVENTPPVAVWNQPVDGASFLIGATINLRATASDPDGSIASVAFLQGSTVLTTDNSAPYEFAWTPAAVGSYTLQARATDNAGGTVLTTPVTITIDAVNVPPTVSMTAPANGSTFDLGAAVTLAASAGDSDGQVQFVEFFDGATALGRDSVAPFSFIWTEGAVGAHSITARAVDNDNASTTSTAVSLTVIPPNVLPTAALTAPASGSSATLGIPTSLTATATDPDGVVRFVEFREGASVLGRDSTAPYSFSWTPAVAGSRTLTARATDDRGGTTISTGVTVFVSAANTAPTVSITTPAAGAQLTQGVAATVSATAADTDGQVVAVTFFDAAVQIGVDSTAPFSISWTPSTAGPHTLVARATDDDGAQTTSTAVGVTVSAPNQSPTVQLTAPTAGANLLRGTPVTMSANAADADGTIRCVEFREGASTVGVDSVAPYSISWTPATAGVRSLTARAIDDDGAITTSTAVSVTVTAPSVPPTVSITAPANGASIALAVPATVSASASDADDGVRRVEFRAGATTISIDSAAPYSVSWTPATPGPHSLTAIATDLGGNSTTSGTVTVTVTNRRPAVTITAPAAGSSFLVNTAVTLSATASDPDGSVRRVEFLDGATVVLVDSVTPYTGSWTPTVTGTHTLSARATDQFGLDSTTAGRTVTITAVNVPPTVSLTAPADGATLTINQQIALAATANDPDGSVSEVAFLDGATVIGQDNSAPYTVNWTPSVAGARQLTARATDSAGAVTTSTIVNVTVQAPNVGPTVSITAPAAGDTLPPGAPVTVSANASDSDGNVVSVTFLAGATIIGVDNNAPFNVVWTPSAIGGVTLTAVAEDNDGAESTSAGVNVLVRNASPVVSVTAPTAGAIIPLGDDVLLQASASDPDGSIAEVAFFVNGAEVGVDSSAPYSFDWMPSAPGNFNLTARATDNLGTITTSSTVGVQVRNAPPGVTLTAPTAGSTVPVGAPVSLSASASDADGTIRVVTFWVGTTLVGTDSVAPYGAVWTPATAGTFSLTARATDDLGAMDTSAVVSVTAQNGAPVVTLTAPASGASLAADEPVTVSATATDPDGSVVEVRFFANGTQIGIDSSAPYAVAWTPVNLGAVPLTARATDNLGTVTTSAAVNVTVVNNPPVVTISLPPDSVLFSAGDTINFSGSATDPESGPLPGSSLTWWAEMHHDTHTHPFLPETQGATGQVVIPRLGHTEENIWYRFYLRAEDARGLADTVYHEIIPRKSTFTITSIPTGATVTIDGQPRTTPFSILGVVGVERELGAATQAIGDSIYAFTSWSDGGAASHVIRTPLTNTTFTLRMTATGPSNQPPVVTITAPTAGALGVVGTPMTFAATASDPDGTVARVTFFDGATQIAADETAPFSIAWTPTVQGQRTLTARATDNRGAVTTSAGVTITVNGSGSGDTQDPTVTITAPSDGATGLTGTINITATGTDNVGVTGVEFQVDGVSLGEDTSSPYAVTATAANYTQGVHQVRARSRDAAGNFSPWATARFTVGGSRALPPNFSKTVLSGFLQNTGTAMAFAPDGRLFVAEKQGGLRVFKNNAILTRPFISLSVNGQGERGLLGVAFDPDFATNQYVYVYYTRSTGPNNRISRFTANGDTAATNSELVLLDLPTLGAAQNHNGGAMHFGPDGKLYVAVGDNANGNNSSSTNNLFGKILRLNKDGTIPTDNPFYNTASGNNRAIWALGLRNPFTFGFQPGTGLMHINDVGENSWEEINIGGSGRNYGWPSTEGTTSNPNYISPLFAYGHSSNPTLLTGFSIVGAAFYNPSTQLFPTSYNGSYFFADYVSHWIARYDANTGGVYMFAQLGAEVTDLAVGPDGALYALAYENGNWRISRFSYAP